MSIKAVLFDKDGTLIDFGATFAPATGKVLDTLAGGEKVAVEKLAKVVGFNTRDQTFEPDSVLIAGSLQNIADCLLPHLKEQETGSFLEHLNRLYVQFSLESIAPFDCLIPTLNTLAEMGLPLGVATNDSESAARAHLEHLGLIGPFCYIAGYDSGYGEKPAPGMVTGFVNHLELQPHEIAMVGDSTHDLIAGQKAGACAIAVLSGGARREALAPHADHILDDIGGLPVLIDQINKV